MTMPQGEATTVAAAMHRLPMAVLQLEAVRAKAACAA